jgi:hypothetical protein
LRRTSHAKELLMVVLAVGAAVTEFVVERAERLRLLVGLVTGDDVACCQRRHDLLVEHRADEDTGLAQLAPMYISPTWSATSRSSGRASVAHTDPSHGPATVS